MKVRRVGALLGAVVLTFGLVSSVFAAAPAYSISVTKTADPTSLQQPIAAGTMVTYTVTVTNTTPGPGNHDFNAVVVSDDQCTLSAPTGDDGNGKLDQNETWTYTCQVDASGWSVGDHTNTATAFACHDASIDQCNNDSHDATGSASATVTVLAAVKTVASKTPTTPVTSTTSSSGDSSLPWLAAIIALASLVGLALAPRPRRKTQ